MICTAIDTSGECDANVYAHGYCLKHWRRMQRKNTTALMTDEERSAVARKNGLASGAARRGRGDLMPVGGKLPFMEQLAIDKAREEKRKKRGTRSRSRSRPGVTVSCGE